MKIEDDEDIEIVLRNFIFNNKVINEKSDENYNNSNKIIIDLEMQIWYNLENANRFIDYG